MYPVIAELPSSAGAVQLRVISDEDTVVAVRDGGASGTGIGVALAILDASPVSIPFTADTLKSYDSSFVKPDTVVKVSVLVPSANVVYDVSEDNLYSIM